jgi:putative ABC transport system permease protein
MVAVLRQTKANLRSSTLQSALILVTLLASASLLTVALSTAYVAQGAYDRLFARTHGAHLWLDLDPARVTAYQAEQVLANLSGVEATTGVMPALYAVLFLEDGRQGNQLLREWPVESVRVSRPWLVAGRAPEAGETDAIVLDRNVAAVHDTQVGDTIGLLTEQGRRSLRVVGLAVNSEFCPYPNCSPPRHFLASGGMAALGLLPAPVRNMECWMVGLRLRDAAEPKAILQAAKQKLPSETITGWGTWTSTRRSADVSIQNQRLLLITFSIVAGVAAGFLIANTIGEAVRAQARQIGLLKAVGFTRGQLALVYLVAVLGLALVASLVGLGVGSLAVSLILRDLAAKFGEALIRPPLWVVLAVPSSTLFVAALFTLWPVRRAVRVDAVQAIRTGTERLHRRMAHLPRLAPSLAVGLSDTLSRPLRSALTVLGLAMAALTLTAAVTFIATVRELVSDPALYGFDGDLYAHPSYYMGEAELRRLITHQPDVEAFYAERWGSFRFQGEEEVLYGRFREGDLEAFQFPIVDGRMFQDAQEVVAGYGLARERNLDPGDRIEIILEGQPVRLQVVGVYRENSNLGRMLMFSIETLRRVEPDAGTGRHVLKLRPTADPEAVAEALRATSGDQLDVRVVGQDGAPSDIRSLKRVMAQLSLVLVGIATVGLFSTLWMGVQERRREFGMLKAVGMTPGQVTWSVLLAAVGMALIGYAVGVLLGYPGIRLLMDTVARSVGFGPLHPPLDVVGLILILPAIVLAAVVGALVPAQRAGRVSVVEALRYE